MLFINNTVKVRECFLMAKNGEIIFEGYSKGINQGSIFKGYSMTKTIGFLMVLMAASEGKLGHTLDWAGSLL